MLTVSSAHLGFWIDYNRRNIDKCQILATDFWSRFMIGVVAVSLTLITPYVFRIVKALLIWFFNLVARLAAAWNNTGDGESAELNTPLLPAADDTDRGAEDLSSILRDSENSRDAIWKLTKYGLHRIKEQCESPSIAIVVITTILFGLFVAQAVAGVFSAKIASDRAGLASSNHCGIWQFDDAVGDEPADLDDLNNYQKEARASHYARTCYNLPDPSSPFSCQLFYNQSIAFHTKINQPCPFPSSELCLDGPLSAVMFDTGLVDASVIGINAATTHKFRRTTSCSPLNMSDPYIRPREDANHTSYQYYYGPKDNIAYTFNTSGHPFDWLVPVYSVNTYFSSLFPEDDYWRPIPELKQPGDSTLTIMFISSMHVFHEKPSLDPIFYANEPRHIPGLRRPYYYNSDPRARALACVDKSEVCSSDGKTCWSMTSPLPDSSSSSPAYWLMKWSLENSNIYDSIKWRLGTALLAQESISQSVSIPLPHDQWQIEASQLFATSLARIQYDVWGIANGEDRQRPGYIDVTPDEAKGRLCGLYKFNTSDYTNINLVAFIGLILLALAIFYLSLPASSGSSQTLKIGVLVNFIWDLILKIVEKIGTWSKAIYQKSKAYFKAR